MARVEALAYQTSATTWAVASISLARVASPRSVAIVLLTCQSVMSRRVTTALASTSPTVTWTIARPNAEP